MAADSKDKKTTSGKKDSWKHDPEYIRYVESGESAAVFIVRDVVQAVNTSGKWISIVSMNSRKEEPDGWAFDWIVCELFPRKIQPYYIEPKSDNPKDIQEARDYNRYLTWQTARDDIYAQRSKGYHGPKFLVLCKLLNNNKGKCITLKLISAVMKYQDQDGNVWEFMDSPDEQETIKIPLAPNWEYRITYLKRLNDAQAEYITLNHIKILDNIELEGKITPEILGITSQSKKETKKNDEPRNNKPASRKTKTPDVQKGA